MNSPKTAEDVMHLKVSEVLRTYSDRDLLFSALEEVVRHCPSVPKHPIVKTLRSIAAEAIDKVKKK